MEKIIEDKLRAIYKLQQIDSRIDNIRVVRGELPLEVKDLEDEITGLETRLTNNKNEIKELKESASTQKTAIQEAKTLIAKYEKQQNNVKNNREYDALLKELELQKLDILASDKKIKQFQEEIEQKNESLKSAEKIISERNHDLKVKKSELNEIVEETEKEEKQLEKSSKKASALIEERLLLAYSRIRKNAKNGLAVVAIDRDSCGGCFNTIPPQRQLDIRQRKKIIVCEHCGRILVDAGINEPELVK